MKYLSILAILCLISSHAIGKKIGTYDWQKDRKRYVLQEKEKAFNEYMLLFHKEYNYDWENGDLFLYQTDHVITRVANAEAIERHNRIYISLRNVLEVVEIKARSINKDGKIAMFDKNNLKEVKDENSDNSYKIFAVEGIEPDSEIEYFFILKKEFSTYETVFFQFDTPTKEGSIRFTSPKKLAFDFRVYADTAKVHSDTLDKRNRYVLNFNNVKGSVSEKFASDDANRKRLESKLAFNFTRSNGRINTWADYAKSYYKFLVNVDDQSIKQAQKFSKGLGDNNTWPAIKRIKNVEDKIKDLIRIEEHATSTTPKDVPDILKYKQASVEGVTRLFLLVFEALEIPYQLVVTCDRQKKKFDGSFDTAAFLTDYVFYFPQTNGFISPDNNVLRYPLVPSEFTANKGLFIEPVTVGKVKSAIGFIKDIPALPYNSHKVDHVVSVSFSADLTNVNVSQKLIIVGSDAAYLSTYVNAMTPEDKEKYIHEFLNTYTPGVTISKWSVSSSTVDEIPHFIIESTFVTDHYIESAGQKILFKVGELIGPQSELYSDESRDYDVENVSNRAYDRNITVETPKGYKVNNIDALKMNVAYSAGDSNPYLFASDFSLSGSNLKIEVHEFYKEIFAPRSRYEDFRKVVNAAADFNKIVLVLEK